MADNFLEKRQEAYRAQAAKGLSKKVNTVIKLAEKSAALSFDGLYRVRTDQLEKIVQAALAVDSLSTRCFILSQNEQQRLVEVCNISIQQGTEGILLGVSGAADTASLISIGRVFQMMLLQAAEIGLSVSYTQNFDAASVVDALSLSFEPVMLLAVGRAVK